MFNGDTDRAWEIFGRDDPYFGVLTEDRFRTVNLTDDNKEEFFRSGYGHIDRVLKTIRKHIDPDYTVGTALDFGCGVGRLVVPLAELAEYVVGVDVSDSMLNEAKKNCEARSIRNVGFVKSDDTLSLLDGKFHFIHAFIVFQHIPIGRGERILENLIAHLEDDGVCVIHFTYAKDYHINHIKKLVLWTKAYIPLSKHFFNFVRGRSLFAPEMQMNIYDLNRLFFVMQKSSILEFHAEYTDHRGELGIVLYFRKPGKAWQDSPP